MLTIALGLTSQQRETVLYRPDPDKIANLFIRPEIEKINRIVERFTQSTIPAPANLIVGYLDYFVVIKNFSPTMVENFIKQVPADYPKAQLKLHDFVVWVSGLQTVPRFTYYVAEV